MAYMLVAMGFTLSYAITYIGLAKKLSVAIIGSGASPWTVMIMVFILWLILGCLMDPGSMVILTMPFLGTTLFDLGFNPIWIGVVATLMTEVGMITPPVGLNLFVLKATSDVPIGLIVRGALPYLGVMVIGLVILCIFPEIALFLPNRM